MQEKFQDFLKIQKTYELKNVSRMNSHIYFCGKTKQEINRKETTAEHVYSALKLADYFLTNEEEFKDLDRLKVYEILMYHDDCEIEADDVCIADEEARKNKEETEIISIQMLKEKYPEKLNSKLLELDTEFRNQQSPEAISAKAIDKLDAMIHELKYPDDWAKKGFTEENVRKWHYQAMQHSKTLTNYFETLISHMNQNGHFNL